MDDVRSTYVATAKVAVDLLSRRQLGQRWEAPSVLVEMDTGSLAAHLARSVLQVEWFLDMPEPDPPGIGAAEYYAVLSGAADPASPLNTGVRAWAAQTAAGGWARLYLDCLKTIERLPDRLTEVPAQRFVLAYDGRVVAIDDYLRTRLVELTLHIDDLARSLEIVTPDLPPEATTIAIGVLVGAARLRHGDLGVLHALARRELDAVQALRVL